MRNKKWILLSLWVFLPGLFHSCQEETVTAEDPELLTRQEVQFEELMAAVGASTMVTGPATIWRPSPKTGNPKPSN